MATAGDMIGNVLEGKYQIDRLLGKGGMGEVYAGTHLQLDRPVAIKIMRNDFAENSAFVARFSREARATARIEHPNAVHVYDFGSTPDGHAFLVMEFIDGVSLRDVLRRTGRFSLPVAVDLLRQACAAVAAAHARGIVHRDIKPENMMVRTDESGLPILKVVDFGLVKLLENETSQLTNQSELMGTPKYMAPEQFSGDQVTASVDVYALGCVFFELLAGRTPFEGTFIEVVGKHVYAEVPTLASVGVEMPEGVERAVQRALAKNPAERTPSAIDLARDLQQAAGIASASAPLESETLPFGRPNVAQVAPSEMMTTVEGDDSRSANDYVTRIGSDPRPTTPTNPPTVVVPKSSSPLEADTAILPDGRVTRPSALPTGLQEAPKTQVDSTTTNRNLNQQSVAAVPPTYVGTGNDPKTEVLKRVPKTKPRNRAAALAASAGILVLLLVVGASAFLAINGNPFAGKADTGTEAPPAPESAPAPNTEVAPAPAPSEPEPQPDPVKPERHETGPTKPERATVEPIPKPPKPPTTVDEPDPKPTVDDPTTGPDRRKLTPKELRELRRLMYEMERRRRSRDTVKPPPRP